MLCIVFACMTSQMDVNGTQLNGKGNAKDNDYPENLSILVQEPGDPDFVHVNIQSSWLITDVVQYIVKHEMQYLQEKCVATNKIKAHWLKSLGNGQVESMPLDVRSGMPVFLSFHVAQNFVYLYFVGLFTLMFTVL